MKNTTTWLLLAACMLLCCSCRHKGFCYDHQIGTIYIDVKYDDDNDPDDIVYLRDKVKATRLLAYQQATGDMLLASDIERKTTRLMLEPDTYHFIAYNTGTQNLSFIDRDIFDTHGAFTRECDILEPLYGSRVESSDIDLGNGEPVEIQADPLWSVGVENERCAAGDTIQLTAIPLHCRYTYEMRNVAGLDGVSRMSSFITGMSRGATLGSTELLDTPVTVAVGANVSEDGRSITGSFMCFGHNPRIAARHRMGLFVEMKDGRRYKLLEGDHFDVTEQVTNAPNRRRVHIVIDGVEMPASGSGAGFDVDLGPWDDGEDLDINYTPGSNY